MTPVYKRTHVKDPVPVLFVDFKEPKVDKNGAFSEANAKNTGIFIERGEELITWILGEIKKMKKIGEFPEPEVTWEHRVSYGETDGMKVVYYGNYFHWFEQARSHFFKGVRS